MDGVSSASAVVALTVQLLSTTRDVIDFLREIQDSPEGLRSLIEFLDQLQRNLEDAKSLVGEQDSSIDLPSSLGSIINAIRICESKIKLFEQIVNNVKGVFDRQSRVRRKWASIKHVMKRGEIQRLQTQLSHATQNLHTALTINVTKAIHANKPTGTPHRNAGVAHVYSAVTSDFAQGNQKTRSKIISLSGSSVNKSFHSLLADVGDPLCEDQELSRFYPETLQRSRVISQESMLHWYAGILGNIYVRTKSKVIDDGLNVHVVHKRSVSEESTFIFRPSFIKNQYELRSVERCGHKFRNLRFDCVVGFKAPVFEMCRSGDIRGLRDAFLSGSVSPDVVNPLGMGLLHYAAGSFQKDLCSWLLQAGVNADRTSVRGRKALTYMGTQSTFGQPSVITKNMIEIARLLTQAQNDLSAFDISMWFREYDGPPEGAEFMLSQDMSQYYICSTEDTDPLYPALASILRLYAIDSKPWESVIRTLIRYRVDIHAPVRRNLRRSDKSEFSYHLARYGTPLDELFLYTLNPIEDEIAAKGWLQILASEGYNILTYLKKESALHIKPLQLTHPSYSSIGYDNERKLIFDFGARPSVAWDWLISPSSSTFPLREEFKALALAAPNLFLIMQSWKDGSSNVNEPAAIAAENSSSTRRKSEGFTRNTSAASKARVMNYWSTTENGRVVRNDPLNFEIRSDRDGRIVLVEEVVVTSAELRDIIFGNGERMKFTPSRAGRKAVSLSKHSGDPNSNSMGREGDTGLEADQSTQGA